MKIEDLLSIIAPQERPEAKPTGGANFAQHLEEALAADPKATTALKAPSSLGLVTAIDSLTESNRPAEALEMVLSRLDNYREALAQPDMTLKKISSLAQTLEGDSQRLHSLAQSLPDSSPLKQVMEEAAALAYTESFKFNRGDYV
jgi:hypothetical protein